jgi:hypothetical protein
MTRAKSLYDLDVTDPFWLLIGKPVAPGGVSAGAGQGERMQSDRLLLADTQHSEKYSLPFPLLHRPKRPLLQPPFPCHTYGTSYLVLQASNLQRTLVACEIITGDFRGKLYSVCIRYVAGMQTVRKRYANGIDKFFGRGISDVEKSRRGSFEPTATYETQDLKEGLGPAGDYLSSRQPAWPGSR